MRRGTTAWWRRRASRGFIVRGNVRCMVRYRRELNWAGGAPSCKKQVLSSPRHRNRHKPSMDIDPNKWITGRVVGQKRWADNLFSLQVDADLPPFMPGQFNKLALPMVTEKGEELV